MLDSLLAGRTESEQVALLKDIIIEERSQSTARRAVQPCESCLAATESAAVITAYARWYANLRIDVEALQRKLDVQCKRADYAEDKNLILDKERLCLVKRLADPGRDANESVKKRLCPSAPSG